MASEPKSQTQEPAKELDLGDLDPKFWYRFELVESPDPDPIAPDGPRPRTHLTPRPNARRAPAWLGWYAVFVMCTVMMAACVLLWMRYESNFGA